MAMFSFPKWLLTLALLVINSDGAEWMEIQFRDLPNTGASPAHELRRCTHNQQLITWAAGNYTAVSVENEDETGEKEVTC